MADFFAIAEWGRQTVVYIIQMADQAKANHAECGKLVSFVVVTGGQKIFIIFGLNSWISSDWNSSGVQDCRNNAATD